MKKAIFVLLVAGSAVALGAAGAGAVSITSQFFDGSQLLSDNSGEKEINVAGGTQGILEIGDKLRGIFNIQTIEQSGVTHNLGVGAVNEMTGLFEVEVTNKVVVIPESAPGALDGLYRFTFGPSASFAADVTALGGAGGYGPGNAPLIVLFDDPAKDYTREGAITQAASEATATNGALWAVLGWKGVLGEGWRAQTVTDNLAVVAGIPAPGDGGEFNAGINTLENYSGILQFLTVPTIFGANADWFGSGSVLGIGGVSTPWEVFDNVDFFTNVTAIPEPGTMFLLGTGLLGAGAFGRRRKKKS